MELTFIQTKKSVQETLADLRKLFKKYDIDDWEPIPIDGGAGYAVRYLHNKNWTEIKSTYQPTKAMNIRICFQVISYMFQWENRGVQGLVKGTTFMGAEVVTTSGNREESLDEAFAILGVDPGASLEEVENTYRVKAKFNHPDKFTDTDDKKRAEERFKRIQKAYELIKKLKAK